LVCLDDIYIDGNVEGKGMNMENQEKDKQFAKGKFVDEQFINELIEIYEDLKNEDLKNEQYNSVIFAGHFIKKFKEKNIKMENITTELIDELQNRRTYPLWHILACALTIHEFYDHELSDKYVVVCYIDWEEITYSRAKIIGNIDELDLSRKDLEIYDVETIVDLDNDEFIANEDLSEYHGKNRILKAMSVIKKEFPGGTRFVAINL
jgi:hypothetical protein